MYFEKAGPENTEETLKIAKEEALKRGIKSIVAASTVGDTGIKAAKMLKGTGIKLVVVTHNTGFGKEGSQQFDPQIKKEIEDLGGVVFTGTMVTRGLGAAIKGKMSFSYEELVANTLRILGQGMKVCAEITAMASDAGLVPFTDLIAVGGTGRGADTAVVIKANSSNNFFDLKIKEVLAKPKEF